MSKSKRFEVRECGREEWEKFRRYHYLSSELATACKCFGLYDDGKIIGFCATLHQPHPSNRKLKRCSRLVIMPDYQGIGLGYEFLNSVAEYYKKDGYTSIVTSAKNFIHKLDKSDKWICIRYSTNNCSSKKSAIDFKRRTIRTKCKTASFVYK